MQIWIVQSNYSTGAGLDSYCEGVELLQSRGTMQHWVDVIEMVSTLQMFTTDHEMIVTGPGNIVDTGDTVDTRRECCDQEYLHHNSHNSLQQFRVR